MSQENYRWRLRAPVAHPTISVIERTSESYDEYADRRAREKDAVRVPFGFGRVLDQEPPTQP